MDNAAQIDAKVSELVELLRKNRLDKTHTQQIQQRINKAIEEASFPESLEAFKELDNRHDRLDLMDDLELLLSQHQLDSKKSKRYLYREKFNRSIVAIIGIIMITLGMGMIIMPAPPYFEMFTLFYFNPNDGVTIMDVISLLIVFTGVYLLSTSFMKRSNTGGQTNDDAE
jgi:hypothetical protein